MTENEIGTVVIGAAIAVHGELGPGLLYPGTQEAGPDVSAANGMQAGVPAELRRGADEGGNNPLCEWPGRMISQRLSAPAGKRKENGFPTRPYTRTGIALRSIPAGDGHGIKRIEIMIEKENLKENTIIYKWSVYAGAFGCRPKDIRLILIE